MSDTNTTVVSVVAENDDDLLNYTLARRKQIISEKMKNGVPEDKGETALVLQALDGIDRVSLTRKRLASEEKNGNLAAQSAAIIATLLNATNSNAFRKETDRAVPMINNDLPELPISDAESVIGTPAGDLASFRAKMGISE